MPVPLQRFTPPSGLDDLTAENALRWSTFLSGYFRSSRKGSPSHNDGPRNQFFHPLEDDIVGDLVRADISWTAFPRQVKIGSVGDVQRWIKADQDRSFQDEYCEWSVTRDEHGQITRVEFTSEGPEYWRVLGALQPDTVLELYREHVSPQVQRQDLFPGGEYHPLNRWNNSTRHGAMHLVQRNNTLSAEIELAAGASIVRRRDGQLVQDTQALIRCSRFGAPERHSDPHIGSEVNALARQGRRVCLADPVGLYIAGVDFEDFELPTNQVRPEDCWHVMRGNDRAVRVVIAPPDGEDFTISDITIGGRNIQFGGQVADKMTIGLTGWATENTNYLEVVEGCWQAPEADAEPGIELAPLFRNRR